MGRPQAAEATLREAFALRDRVGRLSSSSPGPVLPPHVLNLITQQLDTWDLPAVTHDLVELLRAQGRFEEALAALASTIEKCEMAAGKDDMVRMRQTPLLDDEALVLKDLGRSVEAEVAAEKAASLRAMEAREMRRQRRHVAYWRRTHQSRVAPPFFSPRGR